MLPKFFPFASGRVEVPSTDLGKSGKEDFSVRILGIEIWPC